jgi:hypothetical protein
MPPDPGLAIVSAGGPVGVFDVNQDRVTEALRLEWGNTYSITYESGAYVARGKDGQVYTGAIPDQLIRALYASLDRRNAS